MGISVFIVQRRRKPVSSLAGDNDAYASHSALGHPRSEPFFLSGAFPLERALLSRSLSLRIVNYNLDTGVKRIPVT